MHLLALEAVTNVHSTEHAARFFVEELVARPVQTSDQYSSSTLRTLNVPAALGHVTVNTLEEIILERCFGLIQICFLFGSLGVAEVHVALKGTSLLSAETSKGSHSA